MDSITHCDSSSLAYKYRYSHSDFNTGWDSDFRGCAFTNSHTDIDPESYSIGHCFGYNDLYLNPNQYPSANSHCFSDSNTHQYSHRHADVNPHPGSNFNACAH